MGTHYRIVKLEKNRSLWLESRKLKVDLDVADLNSPIGDDEDFLKGKDKNTFFWVSGGGTYLINGRYFLVVKRADSSRVNPGKFSLFTGRADSIDELLDPKLLVREMFEEIILMNGNSVLQPTNETLQPMIDGVYKNLKQQLGLLSSSAISFDIAEVEIPKQDVELVHKEIKTKMNLTYHINDQNDINVLTLFGANLNLSGLTARDGEFHIESGKVVAHNREVFLLDLFDSKVRSLSSDATDNSFKAIDEGTMTGHLKFLVQQAKEILK